MAIATHKPLHMLRSCSCFSPTSVRLVRQLTVGSASIPTLMVKYFYVEEDFFKPIKNDQTLLDLLKEVYKTS